MVFKTGGQGNVSIILRSGQKVVCVKQINAKPSLVDSEDVEYMKRLLRQEAQSMGMPQPGYAVAGAGVSAGSVASGNIPSGYSIGGVSGNSAAQAYANYGKLSNEFYTENNGGKISRGSILPKVSVPLEYIEKNRIALEIAVDDSVEKLEEYWNKLRNDNQDNALGQIFEILTPFYSVESKGVDELGGKSYRGAELYRLRLMLKDGSDFNVEVADGYCSRLSSAGITCNVVKEQ
jgi:hypothetical protein